MFVHEDRTPRSASPTYTPRPGAVRERHRMGIDVRTGRWSRLVVGAACAAAITVGLPGVALAAPSVPPATPSAQSTARPAAQSAARSASAESTARSAAQSADAARRARTAWETHGRPTALVIVRPTSVDLVDQGRLTRRIPRTGGTLTLAALDRYLPPDWLSITAGTAKLSAAVVLTPAVTLDVGAPVTTLQLAGGRDRTRRRVALHRRWRSDAARGHRDVGGPHLRPGDGARSGPPVRPRVAGRPAHGHRRHAQRPRHRTARRPGADRRRGPPGRRLPHRQHRVAGADVAAAQRHRAPARRFPGCAPRRESPSATRRATGWSCAAIAARR